MSPWQRSPTAAMDAHMNAPRHRITPTAIFQHEKFDFDAFVDTTIHAVRPLITQHGMPWQQQAFTTCSLGQSQSYELKDSDHYLNVITQHTLATCSTVSIPTHFRTPLGGLRSPPIYIL